jgi:arylsulfatase A-like enzyme
MKRVDHMGISILMSIFLSAITLISVTLTSTWSTRNIYLLVYFFLFNLTLFSLNALIFSKKRRFVPEQIRKPARITVIISYSLIYLLSTFMFVKTGQIFRIQTLIFLSGIGPLTLSILTFGILLAIVIIFVFLIHKKTNFEDSKKKNIKRIKILFFTSIILFIITITTNAFFLNIEQAIITDESGLIAYDIENRILNEIPNISQEFENPNVIFILLESLSAEKLGIYGHERNTTPNIDKLAKKSIVFTNAFTTSSHSDYAQPGLLSSRYMFTSKTRNLFDNDNPRKFIWDIFKEENYTTGYFSSQDDRWQGTNNYYNFDNLDTYSYSKTDGKIDYGFGYAEKDHDHKTANKAIAWLNETSSKPFFLYLNFQATHNPNAYPKGYDYFKPEDEKINKYDNALRYVDEQVGRIINELENLNLTNNTIIAITSDHGHDLKERHDASGHGFTIYNEELVVPAIAFLPNVPPTIVEERVSHIDFIPTLIDLLGHKIPEEFQGEIMKDGRPLYFAIQSHKYKIGMIDQELKVILDMNKKLIEVYNLTEDPNELNKLDSRKFTNKILKLLFWHHCQIDHYKKEKWNSKKEDRCTKNNNFNYSNSPLN